MYYALLKLNLSPYSIYLFCRKYVFVYNPTNFATTTISITTTSAVVIIINIIIDCMKIGAISAKSVQSILCFRDTKHEFVSNFLLSVLVGHHDYNIYYSVQSPHSVRLLKSLAQWPWTMTAINLVQIGVSLALIHFREIRPGCQISLSLSWSDPLYPLPSKLHVLKSAVERNQVNRFNTLFLFSPFQISTNPRHVILTFRNFCFTQTKTQQAPVLRDQFLTQLFLIRAYFCFHSDQ